MLLPQACQAFISEEIARGTKMPQSDAHKLAVEFVGAGAGALADVLRTTKAVRDPLVSKAGISTDSLGKLNLVPEIKKANDEVRQSSKPCAAAGALHLTACL